MNITTINTPERQATINGLAVVGFIALILAGISLAVYSTRFVPTVADRIGAAAVYLGSVFTPTPGPGIAVIPTPVASTTISFGQATSSVSTSTVATVPGAVIPRTLPVPAAGSQTSITVPVGGAGTATLFGRPDLIVTISAIGYLTSASTDTFIASAKVPDGERPAVKFTVKNVGTNIAAPWRFSAKIPTRTSFTFRSDTQIPLNPGESIEYTLGFDRARSGTDRTITLITDFENKVLESNENNNDISANFTIE